jgi:hypothetical protein
MQCKDGEFVPTEPGSQITVTHGAEQSLRHDGKNLISNSVTINIVDLFEAIQVQKDQSVNGTFSWRGSGCSLECIVELSPIGKPRQSILESKRARVLLGRETPSAFSPLLEVSSYREHQKTQSHNCAKKESFIELDCSLVRTRPIGVLKNVNLECEVQGNKNDSEKDGKILETRPMPNHKVPHALDVHRPLPGILPLPPLNAKRHTKSRI